MIILQFFLILQFHLDIEEFLLRIRVHYLDLLFLFLFLHLPFDVEGVYVVGLELFLHEVVDELFVLNYGSFLFFLERFLGPLWIGNFLGFLFAYCYYFQIFIRTWVYRWILGASYVDDAGLFLWLFLVGVCPPTCYLEALPALFYRFNWILLRFEI